jgi:hypothetical protein
MGATVAVSLAVSDATVRRRLCELLNFFDISHPADAGFLSVPGNVEVMHDVGPMTVVARSGTRSLARSRAFAWLVPTSLLQPYRCGRSLIEAWVES